jgi:hypothetical protein
MVNAQLNRPRGDARVLSKWLRRRHSSPIHSSALRRSSTVTTSIWVWLPVSLIALEEYLESRGVLSARSHRDPTA